MYPGVNNGFDALIKLERQYRNADSTAYGLTAGHPLYEALLLWEDENHNGISESYELHKLSDEYLWLGRGYEFDSSVDQFGNQFRLKGTAIARDPGKTKLPTAEESGGVITPIYDVWFRTR